MTPYANSSTNSPPFNPVLRFPRAAVCSAQRLRVRAVGTLDGWHFFIADYETRLPIALDFGALPDGFNFNPDTATLYALAQAARRIKSDYPGAVVSMVCTQPAREPRAKGRAAA